MPNISLLGKPVIETIMYLVQGIKEKTGTRKMFQEGKSALMSMFNYTIPHLIRYFEFLLRLNFHSGKHLFLGKLFLCLTLKLFPFLIDPVSPGKSIFTDIQTILSQKSYGPYLR